VEIGVQEAAARLGVSDRRVRALIDSERLAARRAGGRWLIDEAGLSGGVVASRPMSPRMAWAFIVALSRVAEQDAARGSGSGGSELLGRLNLASAERRRVDQRVMRLLAADDPALLLRSWLAKRAARRVYSAAPEDVAALVTDDRVVRSGVSDRAVGISISDEVEGYVALANERDIVDEYLLSQVAPHNVVLHVVPGDSWLSLDEIGFGGSAMFGAVLADLADRGAARESSRIVELLARVRSQVGESGL
jgi:excisionase family DNA binding protein